MLDWSVKLWFACARQRWFAWQVELVYVLELLHWQYFPKRSGAVRFAGHWRATSKSRRTKSRFTRNWELGRKSRLCHTHLRRQKVDCRRVGTNWESLTAQRLSIIATSRKRSTLVVRSTPAAVFTQSRTLVDYRPFRCRRQFIGLWPASWSSGNTFFSGAGGLRFKSRASQIGHSVANG